ncbi:ABC-type transport system periplasmic substrate-binding protein (probable substrate dipeptide/oligopeptide) [Natrialba magadii ATCC 43099]|uniref:ABC-type transport system periplasmic substrate-binding protein (Probable substrate dipeptide/oligopeptide) n=1 Tax=Natrialba magadii (strain ATCC 43099 / DSM 3394 / CCM 3739 / CIP 104546 / IAM 13178 / JCM 8861 / NBRC 102185 / NCIMB 2190 / MS3) TaxID=547559 RepID=D3SVN6_NATMM|nr:ABC transporter substrate-binding protein [Natrialba magadii]ADD03605.1 ABC-type transport system periplasmic substrate-binding protein (probable substrate dipeptide/oligopeptide) [Natrialba magadii ATCC 43099]ELY29060.1 family 5 extracellular solute-binding protein [Natrialba magadii ATCC 43099]
MKRVAPSVTRRSLLAGASGVGLSALAGCSERFWSRAENTGPDQVELTIKTVPADDDAIAATIMSQLRENFQAAGIDATHEPIAEAELYRDVLIDGDYDVFVLKHAGLDEYDALHGLLHSQFVTERGWQNPFQFSDIHADELLDEQRATDRAEREETLTELFNYLLETVPFTVVAYPDRLGGTRETLSVSRPPRRAIEIIDILSQEFEDGPFDRPLELGIYGEALTDRLNPLIVDRNRVQGLMELLYDPLARQSLTDESEPGEPATYSPWLAEEIEWDEESSLTATVTLRSDLHWHDGEPLDADDVDFTFRFLGDTSLGAVDGTIPAPRYRDRQTLIDDSDRIEVLDDRTVVLPFGSTARPAATRILSVPILPQHIWEPLSEVIAERQTRALVHDNEEPVGSGLFELVETSADELVLEPFEDHVLRSSTVPNRPSILEHFSQFEGIRYRIDPNVGAMLDALEDGEIDVTAGAVPPDSAAQLTDADDVSMVTTSTSSFYMVGYNIHHPELGNPNFRQIVSQLIDREYVVSEFFNGFASEPTRSTGLFGYQQYSQDDATLEGTTSTNPISVFPGSDGEIDPERVRQLFTEAGYQYDDDVLLE